MSLRPAKGILLREGTENDRSALATLAELDSAAPLKEPVLLAFSGGRLLAALSLRDGRVLADPWRRTAELVALLRLRAVQLAECSAGDHGRGRVIRAVLPGQPIPAPSDASPRHKEANAYT